jgi:nitroreductase
MELITAIRERVSVRHFNSSKDIPDQTILDIIELGNWAPSAGNLQARDFIIVRDLVKKQALAKAAFGQNFIIEAPVAIVVCANRNRSNTRYGARGEDLYSIQDSAAAIQNMLLVIHSYGLGACWVGAFDEGQAAKTLKLPEHVRPVAIIPIGYPTQKPEPSSRIEIEKLVHFDEW